MTRDDPGPSLPRDTPQARADATNRARLLDLLAVKRNEAPTMTDLDQRGVQMPGQAIYELELDGYPLERVRHRDRTRGCTSIGYHLSGPNANAETGRPDTRRMR